MRERTVAAILAFLAAAAEAFAAAAGPPSGLTERVARTQVPFVQNNGQLPGDIAFSARTLFGTVDVTRGGRLTYTLRTGPSEETALTETLVRGRPRPTAGTRAATRVIFLVATFGLP